MPKTTLFIGSSAAARSQAKTFVKKFTSPTLEFLPWWDAFTAGNTIIDDLDNICSKIQGAVLLFSPESESLIRGNRVSLPNLNVLYEFGYFYGHFGKKSVAILKYGEFYLPSDFGGYIHIYGNKSFKRGKAIKIGKKTEREFARWIAAL